MRKDKRGAVAFEVLIVLVILIPALLLPIVDLVIAAAQYMSAYQAMRDLGQYTQYHIPPDVTNWSSWASSLPTVSGHIITTAVMCGDTSTPCSAGNTASPKFYTFSTTITLTPKVVSALKGTFTLAYAEQFQ